MTTLEGLGLRNVRVNYIKFDFADRVEGPE